MFPHPRRPAGRSRSEPVTMIEHLGATHTDVMDDFVSPGARRSSLPYLTAFLQWVADRPKP